MKYRKKPVEIEAVQFINGEVDEKPDWILDMFGELAIYVDPLGRWFIRTLEGDMRVLNGDYILRGVKGEIYSCRQDIFEQIYEKVKEGEQE